jgi:hypothetical protein
MWPGGVFVATGRGTDGSTTSRGHDRPGGAREAN